MTEKKAELRRKEWSGELTFHVESVATESVPASSFISSFFELA